MADGEAEHNSVEEEIEETPAAAFLSGARILHVKTHTITATKPAPEAIIACMQMKEIDMPFIRNLIRKKVDVNKQDSAFGWTPLQFAANAGDVHAINALLEAKAAMKTRCQRHNTPLHVAARSGHEAICKVLLSRKSPVDAKNADGYTPLFWSAINGYHSIASLLVRVQADVHGVDKEGRTPCMHAARNGHAEVLRALLAQGLDLTKRDRFGLTTAEHAREHLELRKHLLSQERLNKNLLDAVARNDIEAAREALDAGAAVHGTDDIGWGVLTWAMMNKSIEMVRLLALSNADVTDGGTAIQELALGEHRHALELAMEQGLGAQTRLLEAAQAANWPAVEASLDDGAKLASQELGTRLSCLMYAATQGNCTAACMLIARKAPPDQQDQSGWTALHFAVQTRSIELVSILVFLSCNVNAVTHDGHTAQHIAARADDAAMVQLLYVAKCFVQTTSLDGHTPLQIAVLWSSVEAATAIICLKGDVSQQNSIGQTLFGLACKQGHSLMIQALLEPLQIPPDVCDDEWFEAHESADDRFNLVQEARKLHQKIIRLVQKIASRQKDSKEADGNGKEAGSSGTKSKAKGRASVRSSLRSSISAGSSKSRSLADAAAKARAKALAKSPAPPKAGSRATTPTAAAATPKAAAAAKGNAPRGFPDIPAPPAPAAEGKAAQGQPASTAEGPGEESALPADGAEESAAAPSAERSVPVDGAAAQGAEGSVPVEGAAAQGAEGSVPVEGAAAQGAEGSVPVEGAAEEGGGADEVKAPPLMKVEDELRHRDVDGLTPLALAAVSGHTHLIPLLLELKAPLDTPDEGGNTALMHAVSQGRFLAADLLIRGGADERVRNTEYEDAASLAPSKALRELVQRASNMRCVPGGAIKVKMKTSIADAVSEQEEDSDDSEKPKPVQVYRLRVEGLPLLAPTDLVKMLVEEELYNTLCNDRPLQALRIEMPDDLVMVGKPRGFAYIDFETEEEAEAIYRASGKRKARARANDPSQHEVRLVRLGKRLLTPEEVASMAEEDDD